MTWTEEDSPYVVTETVQIPSDVTLTIEPGVTITMPSDGDMFLLQGAILAHGTIINKITIDGGGNSVIIRTLGGEASADLDYCIIQNGGYLWYRSGSFNMTHSEIINCTSSTAGNIFLAKSCIGFEPTFSACYVEYNKFINSGGIYTYFTNGEVYIRYNLFQNMYSPIHYAGDTSGSNAMIVKNNTFIDIEGTILSLAPGFDITMNASENYWGTQDTNIIDDKIYDRNDSIAVLNYIDYLPILTTPHPDTPLP